MKKLLLLLGCIPMALIATAQVADDKPEDAPALEERPHQPRHFQRPSTFDQVAEVRDRLKLDHSQFDKVYTAYDKYNKALFGDNSQSGAPRGGMGGPGGGPGGRGGMGGPGGGPGGGGFGGPGGGGFGGPGGAPGGNNMERPSNKSNDKFDVEKYEKNKVKQEEKLCKSMKKLFKKTPELYEGWLEIRSQQLERMTPPMSERPDFDPNNNDQFQGKKD